MEERRSTDRRGSDRRADRAGPGRRHFERRNGGWLVESEAVRRVFPIAEGDTPYWLRRREGLQRGALIAADLGAFAALLVGLALLTPVRTSPGAIVLGLVATIALAKLG